MKCTNVASYKLVRDNVYLVETFKDGWYLVKLDCEDIHNLEMHDYINFDNAEVIWSF